MEGIRRFITSNKTEYNQSIDKLITHNHKVNIIIIDSMLAQYHDLFITCAQNLKLTLFDFKLPSVSNNGRAQKYSVAQVILFHNKNYSHFPSLKNKISSALVTQQCSTRAHSMVPRFQF